MLFPVGEISQTPHFETKKALFLVDLQNDFVSLNGKLPVANAADFVKKLPSLVASFRAKGDIIWARTEYQGPRPVISPENGNCAVVLEEFLELENQGLATEDSLTEQSPNPDREKDDEVQQNDDPARAAPCADPEAFLSSQHTEMTHQCCLPGTNGGDFPELLAAAVDKDRDLVVIKSHYSAFVDTSLLQYLRTRLITQIYICGSLSNISVYATALDAVRHGVSVTIVEDCVGYRSDKCHFEAMRQMADAMGAEGTDYQELMDDLAGLLGDVIKEEDFTTKYQVSMHRPAASIETSTGTARGGEKWFSKLDQTFSTYTELEYDLDDAYAELRDENNNSSSHESLVKSDSSGERAFVAGSPEPAPGRKRSTSDIELEEPVPKSTHMPSQRRASQEDHNGSFPKTKTSRIRVRRRKSPQNPVSAAPNPPPSKLGQSKPFGDLPNGRDIPSDPDTGDETSKRYLADGENGVSPRPRPKRKQLWPLLGPHDRVGEGDSRIMYELMDHQEGVDAFYNLKTEVKWQKMYHRSGEVPRLVAVQGDIDEDGTVMPIYRHPADESPVLLPFSETVQSIREHAEKVVGHPLNHVLIQLYRNSEDNISEHSDKTLDIVRGSSIVNYSVGAMRTMTLRTKKSAMSTSSAEGVDPIRPAQRVHMPHNSLFILGQDTNQNWLHSIRADKRPVSEKSAAELAYNSERISLTFRHIGTFIDSANGTIWGQGATSKGRGDAREILKGDESLREGEMMIRAFGQENHQSRGFNWDEQYGRGFDVVNFVTKEA